MKFAFPWYLYAIPVVLALCHGFFVYVDHRRNRRLKTFLGDAYPGYLKRTGKPPLWLPQRYFLALCLTFLLIAGARPYVVPKDKEDELRQRVGTDFMIAIDASKSMLARDTETTQAWRDEAAKRPTRNLKGDKNVGRTRTDRRQMIANRKLEELDEKDSFTRIQAAKEGVRQLIKIAQGDRIGLIAFTKEAGLRAPLTYDHTALGLVLESIGPGSVPPGGTSIESAIIRAQRIFEDKKVDRPVLIILSDGEEHEGNGSDAAATFRREQNGIVHTVGIGSTAGAQIQISQRGKTPFMRDEFGQTVTTRLEKLTLNRIASASGGRYVDFGKDGEGLMQLYRDEVRPLARAKPDEFPPNAIDLYQIPLLLAFLAVICEMLVRAKIRPIETRAILQT
jgi:Mg-chelatase subunit ChlD